MLDRFIKCGYVVITRRIARDDAAQMADSLREERQWDQRFGPVGMFPRDMDPYRLTRQAPDDVAQAMRAAFRDSWRAFFPYSEANDWVVLRSRPGGPRQPPHTDFTFPPNFEHLDHARMPAGIIVALEPGAHVFVYGWNRLFPDPEEEVRVNLDVGDAIIFRGDLIHGGGSYAEDNIRLHAYLDVVGFPRRHNRTYRHPMIVYDGGDMTQCPLHGCNRTGSASTIRRHLSRDHHVRFSNRHVLPSVRTAHRTRPYVRPTRQHVRALVTERDASESSASASESNASQNSDSGQDRDSDASRSGGSLMVHQSDSSNGEVPTTQLRDLSSASSDESMAEMVVALRPNTPAQSATNSGGIDSWDGTFPWDSDSSE